MMRLVPDHSRLIQRSPLVEFTFDGQTFSGHLGETVLAALMRAGHLHLRDAPMDGTGRGAFCCMGLCQECVVEVDGSRVESCRLPVAARLHITSVTHS